MPGCRPKRVFALKRLRQSEQACVLRFGIATGVRAFELDADGEIVAPLAPKPLRVTRVPGAFVAGHKLQEFASAANQKVRGDAQLSDLGIIGMRLGVQPIGKKLDDRRAAKFPRRKADVMNDH